MGNIVISHREEGKNSSCFLNVNDVLKGQDSSKILNVYKGILFNINSYESSNITKIEDLEVLFHNRLTNLTDDKAHIFIKILAAVFTLGLFPYIRNRKIKEIHRIHTSIKHHISKIRESLKPKLIKPKLKALEELNNARLPNLDCELNRLKKNDRIDKSLKSVENSLDKNLNLNQKVAFAQSLELREKIKDQYFVFNHGQNLEMMIINIVAKKLKQLFEPQQYVQSQILRHDVYLKHNQNVEWFREHLKNGSDHDYRNELICCDCHLESTIADESAIDFFAGAINIALEDSNNFISVIANGILRNYFPDPSTRAKLSNKILQLVDSVGPGGTLYSICIPKDKFEATAFFCEPFGRPVEENKYTFEHLELLQNGTTYPNCPEMPYEGTEADKVAPQVRLLSHKLNPNDGTIIVANSTINQDEVDSIEKKIELLIQKAQFQFRIA